MRVSSVAQLLLHVRFLPRSHISSLADGRGREGGGGEGGGEQELGAAAAAEELRR
jgi:hypothetical protein